MKRRQSNGEYESTWQEIPSRYIKQWGTVSYNSDDILPNFYTFSDFNFDVINNDGYFSGTDNATSFWFGYLTRYRTLIKIEAGYIDTDETEYPTNSSLFMGIIIDDLQQKADNTVTINARHLSSVFKEVPAVNVPLLGATQTASDMLIKIRDYQDSNAVKIFQKYFSLADWSITTTTNNYNMATSTSMEGSDCWELMTKLSAAENYILYISRDGKFYFNPRGTVSTTSYHFAGIGEKNSEYGHNIMSNLIIDDGMRKVFNRVRVKMAYDETLTSYYIKNEAWNWGDSSSSFMFGVRTYDYQNEWLNTASASIVGDNIYNEFCWPKLELQFDTKFCPQLNLFDRTSVTYRTRSPMGGDLWGYCNWGSGIWAGQAGFNINISDSEYMVVALEHDLNTFKSNVRLRTL